MHLEMVNAVQSFRMFLEGVTKGLLSTNSDNTGTRTSIENRCSPGDHILTAIDSQTLHVFLYHGSVQVSHLGMTGQIT